MTALLLLAAIGLGVCFIALGQRDFERFRKFDAEERDRARFEKFTGRSS